MSRADMENPDRVEQRLIDLEVKASFTEDLVDHLNRLVVRQQEQIDLLTREVSLLRLHTASGHGGELRSLRDDLPPHY